jgi:hypothetical protein
LEVDVVRLASELPNDNPALHGGVMWICDALTGPARAERVPVRGAAPAPIEEAAPSSLDEVRGEITDDIVVEELEPIEMSLEGVATESSVLPPPPDDPFTLFVCTLADVAIGAGAPHVAAILPGLLFDGRLPEPLDPDVAEALRESGIHDGEQVSPAFVAVTAAWRAILHGTSEDFDACGASMLDEWASELLGRLLASPTRTSSLRQELRSRGVAAFGMTA